MWLLPLSYSVIPSHSVSSCLSASLLPSVLSVSGIPPYHSCLVIGRLALYYANQKAHWQRQIYTVCKKIVFTTNR